MTKYYGIGKEGNFNYRFSFFLGNRLLTVAFWTSKYKFLPRFYYYSDCDYSSEYCLINIKRFFGLLIY